MTVVEIRKPTSEEAAVASDRFDRGERVIMVDGVRWGRTIVTHHGVHGTKHTFKQDEGEVLLQDPDKRYPVEWSVRSSKRRRYMTDDSWRPTEERVQEMAAKLVADGILRDPSAVKAEQKAANQRWREERAAAEKRRVEEFRAKAAEALLINDPSSPMIDRVVAAMEWAQTR